jgi:Trk K+ transport system NAD-binding subunit
VGVVCASDRGTDNIAETLAIAGTKGVEIVSATIADEDRLTLVDRTADIILMSREAIAQKLDQRLQRPERVRPWSYEFDPAGLELLRRSIERVSGARRAPAAGVAAKPAIEPDLAAV